MSRGTKKRARHSRKRKGYTLFETVSSMAVFSLISLVGFSSTQLVQTVHEQTLSAAQQETALKTSIDILGFDLRSAQSTSESACGIITDSSTTSVVNNFPLRRDNPRGLCVADDQRSTAKIKTLSFKVPEDTPQGGGYTSYKTIRYQWFYNPASPDYQKLVRRVRSSLGVWEARKVIATGVTSFTFSKDPTNSKVVRVRYDTQDQTITSQFLARN
jgi:type II secretory pathway component PulJ